MTNVVSLGTHLLRTNLAIGESLLPPAYVDYRARVRRWRDQLSEAGNLLEIERNARRKANEIFEKAARADEQLKATEAEKGWQRVSVP